MKLIAILVVAVTALTATAALRGAPSERADYGDAPDGRPTGYGPQGEFPSLLKSDGARARTTSYAHLGKDVTRELNSLQVDQDRRDDGVFVRLVPCQESEALVLVTLPTAGQPARGTGFLNIFFDWNRDGRWEGADRRCGGSPPREWIVRNAPVNLSNQGGREQLYRVRFRAGSFVGSMWTRTVLSVDEQLRDETGRGAVARGEVEDSIHTKDGNLTCFANPVGHGKSGAVTVAPFAGAAGLGVRILSAQLRAAAATAERTITPNAVVAPDQRKATFTYRSLKKDARKNPVVVDAFQVEARVRINGVAGIRRLDCSVLVQHAQQTGSGTPIPPPTGGGASRLGWYSGPTENFGSIDFLIARAGEGKVAQKLQFTSRITCTKGVTSQHVHVDGSFPVLVAGGKETIAARSTAFDVGQPIGRPPGSFTASGMFTAAGGARWSGTLRLTYTHQALGSCDTGNVIWQAPAAARPTHTHP